SSGQPMQRVDGTWAPLPEWTDDEVRAALAHVDAREEAKEPHQDIPVGLLSSIPACAGPTPLFQWITRPIAVHPRMCGAVTISTADHRLYSGTSPHTRGSPRVAGAARRRRAPVNPQNPKTRPQIVSAGF